MNPSDCPRCHTPWPPEAPLTEPCPVCSASLPAAAAADAAPGGWSAGRLTVLTLVVTSLVMAAFFGLGQFMGLGTSQIDAGRRYFDRSCRNCHSYEGKGGRDDLGPALDGLYSRTLTRWAGDDGAARAALRARLADPEAHAAAEGAARYSVRCRSNLQPHETEPVVEYLTSFRR